MLRLASDDRLIAHVRNGSETAFEVLFERYHPGLLRFCRHLLGSMEEAEDAVQHSLFAAYLGIVDSERQIELRPWLYTIARNRCMSVLRARRERPGEPTAEPATEQLAAEVQRRQDLRDLLADLARLPEEQRAALLLAEAAAMPHEEIAALLGCPREKVKALVFQARSSLMTSRAAREAPCGEIREQLATLRGSVLRKAVIRRHVRACAGCREFHDEAQRQRRKLAIALPVWPSLALREGLLSSLVGGGAASAGTSTGTGSGAALAAKAFTIVALVSGGTAGVQAVRQDHRSPQRAVTPAAQRRAPAQPPTTGRGRTPNRPPATAVIPAAASAGADARSARPQNARQRARSEDSPDQTTTPTQIAGDRSPERAATPAPVATQPTGEYSPPPHDPTPAPERGDKPPKDPEPEHADKPRKKPKPDPADKPAKEPGSRRAPPTPTTATPSPEPTTEVTDRKPKPRNDDKQQSRD